MEITVTQAHCQAWAEAQDGLRRELGDARYVRWIAPLQVLSEKGAEWRLGVRSLSICRWVEKNYSPVIRSALERASLQGGHGKSVRVVFEVQTADGGESARDDGAREAVDPRGDHRVDDSAGASLASEPDPAENGVPGRVCGERQTGDATAGQSLETFVVGRSNDLAHNAVAQVAREPGGLYNPLFLYGPSGVGKSHLLRGLRRAYRNRRGLAPRVRLTSGERLFNEYVASIRDKEVLRFRDRYRSLDVLLLDDLQGLIGKSSTQIEVLHTLAALFDRGAQVVVAADRPPRELTALEPTLVGRFLGGLVVGIGRPDYDTRLQIARSLSKRLKLAVSEGVLETVARSLRGTACELSGALLQIDLQERVRGAPLSPTEARGAIAALLFEQERRLTLPRIAEVVATHFGLAPAKLTGPGRQRAVRVARDVAMFLARECTGHSLAEIGAHFGGRRHGAVRAAILRVEKLLAAEDDDQRPDLDQIRDSLSS